MDFQTSSQSPSAQAVAACSSSQPQPVKLSLGVATWNINHLGKSTKEAKMEAKQRSILRMFKNNPWLEVLVLQEVNGIDPVLELEKYKLRVLSTGPHLLSQSFETDKEVQKRLKSGSSNRDPKPQLKNRYSEYYPILCRAGAAIKLLGVSLAWPNGTLQKLLNFQQPAPLVFRSPDNPDAFRPVIVFRLLKDGQTIHLGVVHTSPSGSEFERVHIFQDQIKGVLPHAKADQFWTFGGDFYLTPEARVISYDEGLSDLQASRDVHGPGTINEHRVTASLTFSQQLKGLQPATSVSGTNWETQQERDQDTAGVQIADFFLATDAWKIRVVGLMEILDRGGLVQFDPHSYLLGDWVMISDHAPVGAFLSTFDDQTARAVVGHTRETDQTVEHQLILLENIRQMKIRAVGKELEQLQLWSTQRALSPVEVKKAQELRAQLKTLQSQDYSSFSAQDFDPRTPSWY